MRTRRRAGAADSQQQLMRAEAGWPWTGRTPGPPLRRPLLPQGPTVALPPAVLAQGCAAMETAAQLCLQAPLGLRQPYLRCHRGDGPHREGSSGPTARGRGAPRCDRKILGLLQRPQRPPPPLPPPPRLPVLLEGPGSLVVADIQEDRGHTRVGRASTQLPDVATWRPELSAMTGLHGGTCEAALAARTRANGEPSVPRVHLSVHPVLWTQAGTALLTLAFLCLWGPGACSLLRHGSWPHLSVASPSWATTPGTTSPTCPSSSSSFPGPPHTSLGPTPAVFSEPSLSFF